jgi:hypothetical protein
LKTIDILHEMTRCCEQKRERGQRLQGGIAGFRPDLMGVAPILKEPAKFLKLMALAPRENAY